MKANEKALQIHPVSENGTLDSTHVLLPITRKACVLEDDTDNPIVFQRPIIPEEGSVIEIEENTPPSEQTDSKSSTIKINETTLYNHLKEAIFEDIYPIGSIYMSTRTDIDDPAEVLGFGTWERIKDTFLYAADDDIEDYNVNKTGGNNKAQLLWHTHASNFANAQTVTTSKAFPTKSGVMELEGYFQMLEQEDGAGHSVTWDFAGIFNDAGNEEPNYSLDIIGNHARKARKIRVDAKHTHNISIPALTITGTGDTDADSKLNMPKFLCVKIWKRVAND